MTSAVFAYICAPFIPEKKIAKLRMKEYCRKIYELGYVPICPNLMYPQFLDDAVPEQREARVRMSLSLLRRCRVIVVCGDAVTQEMEREIMLAKRLDIVATTLTGIEKLSMYGNKGGKSE